ncbi:hypothetical protein [Streptomyces sp. NPDC057429]|uniref:hypothetical protein n=1 Tax=Streptomyces sp. NPDC057429 TaxID=3346130 RepID=UPI0036B1D63E
MIELVESEVVAALIASPVALTAALAAYGAGKAQGRGTLESVRRTSQRESYAHLLATAYTFKRAAVEVFRAWEDPSEPEPAPEIQEARNRRLSAALHPVTEAVAVVTLDGPSHIARLAEAILRRAQILEMRAGFHLGPRPDPRLSRSEGDFGRLTSAMDAFAREASTYLNTGKLPRQRRWPRRITGVTRRG